MSAGSVFHRVQEPAGSQCHGAAELAATSCGRIAELESYRPKLADMERQVASLKQQLEIERKIVPDEKEVDGFIKMMDAEAEGGIEIRRYTAKPVSQKDFYTEAPFELELDGPYYSVLSFFDHVGKLERIVNVSDLLVATTKKPNDAKTKHTYQYAPNESVVATCLQPHSSVMTWNRRRSKTGSPHGCGEKVGDAMKLTTGILVLAMATGTGWAQNPDLIVNTKNTMNALQQKSAIDSNAALSAAGVPAAPANHSATPTKPLPSAPVAGQPAAKAPAAVKVSATKSRGRPAGKSRSGAQSAAQKPAAKTVAVIIPKTAKVKAAAASKSVVAADTGAAPEAKPQEQDGERQEILCGRQARSVPEPGRDAQQHRIGVQHGKELPGD